MNRRPGVPPLPGAAPRKAHWLLSVTPLLLGGLLSLPPESLDRVPWAGCWVFPVGDSLVLGAPGPGGEAPYQATRNVSRGRGVRVHDGADLSNRTSGGRVRAAAHGLVIHAGPGRKGNGFGWHVVLAHREPGGGIAYSVYAHLVAGSVTVEAGRVVLLGTPLGRVGRTGRASAPHLHFEVRRPRRLEDRWERASVEDPLAWVAARRPVAREDSAWALPALAWAEGLGAITAETPGDDALTRAQWWRMLAAVRPGHLSPTGSPGAVREALEAQGVLPTDGTRRTGEAPSVEEIRRDVSRLEALGALAPAPPVGSVSHAVSVLARLPWWRTGPPASAANSRAPSPGHGPPSVADAALLLLDVALDHQSAVGPVAPLKAAPFDSAAVH